MAFDASVIADIGRSAPDPAASAGKALTLANALDENKLNKLKLSQENKAVSDQADVSRIVKSGNYTTPDGYLKTASELTAAGHPQAAQDFMKLGADYSTGKYQQQIQQLDLAAKQQDIIAGAFDNVISKLDAMKGAGKAPSPEVMNAVTKQLVLADAKQLMVDHPELAPIVQKFLANPQNLTYSGIVELEKHSNLGQKMLADRRQDLTLALNQKKAQIEESKEAETERHNRATEALGAKKAGATQYSDDERDLLAALAVRNVNLPAGMRSQGQIKATIDGLLAKNQGKSPEQIADDIVSGKLKLTAETSGARIAGSQIGKVALSANELDTFGDQVLSASDAVPRGSFVPWNKLQNLARGEVSSPQLLNFQAKMQALENAYDQLAARSGTDVEKRERIHRLFNEANSPQAVRTLVQAVKQEAAAARNAANRTIAETSGTSIPGTEPSGAAPAAAAGAAGAPSATSQLPPGFVLDK